MQMMRNPAMMQEMMRNQDRAMSNLEVMIVKRSNTTLIHKFTVQHNSLLINKQNFIQIPFYQCMKKFLLLSKGHNFQFWP